MCYDSATDTCPNSNFTMFNLTAQCLTLSKFYTPACQYLEYFGSYNTRERNQKYEYQIIMPPQTGCEFKINGTRSFFSSHFDPPIGVYYIKTSTSTFDNTTKFFKAATLYVQDNGSVLGQKSNYIYVGFVNYDPVNSHPINVTIHQNALITKLSFGMLVLFAALNLII
ncbi:UNKNOWN [Stylonychia lemnae]|uniref:Uncharacterized protein n=1 Tax=Stylonychia lemnae TaxID=5949 RepID=A0A077ZVC0_STYLE|nr:UNKNOWN [Stylonychia lemnae]|eukprot:CDW73840.1 UNKNOWN [Stylonychia lemnae]